MSVRTGTVLTASMVLLGGAAAQAPAPSECYRKIERVMVAEVATYPEWRGGKPVKVVRGRISSGTVVRYCAPNRRIGIEFDGRIIWIDAFAVQLEDGNPTLRAQPEELDKTAGQRAMAPSPRDLNGVLASDTSSERRFAVGNRFRIGTPASKADPPQLTAAWFADSKAAKEAVTELKSTL